MNTQHFQYIVEIERTRSISQAAKNLSVSKKSFRHAVRILKLSKKVSKSCLIVDEYHRLCRWCKKVLLMDRKIRPPMIE